ncbi:phosphoribosylformylglycinamidine synthase, synthetase subunit [hydrocarbon metagenome]|uniref:Phosphoribosylformylglycinamidine synthase, synthetase subunit n=1 Tax=hydrocarbon metagenome TaxID=938273 RepID=A0A0W8G0T9_9ZZZZ
MVGLIEDLKHITTANFKNIGDLIYVFGEDKEELGGSEFLKVIHNKVEGDAPQIDLQIEQNLHNTILSLIKDGFIESAHDISEGGILSALAECCIIDDENPIGAEANIPIKTREDFTLFSESQSRIIVSVKAANKDLFEDKAAKLFTQFIQIGETKKDKLTINDKFVFELSQLIEIYYKAIPLRMNEY